MAISDQLTLLNNSKQAIKNSINQKGGSITDSTPFADYSTAIDNLPSGGDNSDLINLIEKTSRVGLIIPSGVTNIGTSAFYGWTYLQNITIPNSVTIIGREAFGNCEFLTEIRIPENVTYIGNSAFSGCQRLTSVNIPSGVTKIERGLMQNCSALKSINIPSGVTTIEQNAFYSCFNLISVNIPSGVTKIGDGAFQGCSSLTSAIINATTPPTTDGYQKPFNYTTCPIYVPAESVDAYKAATGWVKYASRIYPIQQVATVDNTPVYNYDLGMTSTDTITSENMEKMPAGTSVEFAEGVTNISAGEINYQQVTLPSTFTGFGDSDMIGSSVTTITSNAVTPPSAFRNQLGGSGLTAIYVPSESIDTYKAHDAWSNFSSIIQSIPSE